MRPSLVTTFFSSHVAGLLFAPSLGESNPTISTQQHNASLIRRDGRVQRLRTSSQSIETRGMLFVTNIQHHRHSDHRGERQEGVT
jgi:hypothetical protein